MNATGQIQIRNVTVRQTEPHWEVVCNASDGRQIVTYRSQDRTAAQRFSRWQRAQIAANHCRLD